MLVTGIGQCSYDYLSLVDSFPEIDTKMEVIEWVEQGGGPVATALVALSRLGVHGRFFGVVGDDGPGEKIKRALIDENIDVEGLVTRGVSTSQVAFIAVEKDTGKRTIFWKRPSGKEMEAGELGEDFLRGSDFLLLDGLMADVSYFAAKKAKELGIPVMLDAGRVRKRMLEIAVLSDYVVASEEFARDLGWKGSPEEFQKEIEDIVSRAITITLGDRGSVTYADGKIIEVPAFEVEVVDTTGAGDVFHGGYIFGLLSGWEIEETVIFASGLAAMKCRMVGGRAGIPTIWEVKEFLKERGFDFIR